MPNSLIIPILRIPESLSELQESVVFEFQSTNKSPPSVWYKTTKPDTHALLDGFINIQGSVADDSCLLDISFAEESIREVGEADLAYFVAISAKGNKKFLTLIAHSLRAFGARVLYDDSHFLGGIDKHDLAELKGKIGL
ncbi:hypothetical protein ABIC94_004841 [Variovorax paradoxus]|uniref:hypothetical protein n=1 Tax=Variovorax paradoxus TaxID=34073 RepID=UPI0033922CD6